MIINIWFAKFSIFGKSFSFVWQQHSGSWVVAVVLFRCALFLPVRFILDAFVCYSFRFKSLVQCGFQYFTMFTFVCCHFFLSLPSSISFSSTLLSFLLALANVCVTIPSTFRWLQHQFKYFCFFFPFSYPQNSFIESNSHCNSFPEIELPSQTITVFFSTLLSSQNTMRIYQQQKNSEQKKQKFFTKLIPNIRFRCDKVLFGVTSNAIQL